MEYGKFVRIVSIKDDNTPLRRLLENGGGELEPSAKRLFDVVISAGCQSIVVESEYVDADFKDGHRRFYYLHYKDTDRRCQRVHFFGAQLMPDDLAFLPESIATTYLGFAVIRPLPSHPIGCTILSELVTKRMFPRAYLGESRFLACHAEHAVNLVGNAIKFRGTPWMQQDKLVAACASVAIWVANRHLAERFSHDFKRCTTAKITKLATQYNTATGRGMPSDGLTAEQMVRAFTSLGYEPLYLESQPSGKAAHIASLYLRSSIPVVAILNFPDGGHAITLVGHTLKSDPSGETSSTTIPKQQPQSHNLSEFIPRFIAQDDSGGPLRFLEFFSWDEAVSSKLVTSDDREKLQDEFASVVRLSPPVGKRQDVALLTSLIIPLPKRVTLKGTRAHRIAKEVAKSLLIGKEDATKDRLIFDTFLRPSNDYKKWWSPFHGRPIDVAPLIRRHILPSWIWITEVSLLNKTKTNGRVIGHILQDSSGRGTGDVLDDLIALVGPRSVALASPDGKFQTSARSTSDPICMFRDGEMI